MGDLISRQAVEDAIAEEIVNGESLGYAVAYDILSDLPPVTLQPKQRWIPVSERYPTDTNKCYLVCYEDGCITIEYLYFDYDGYPFFSKMELGVVAWMPLPEPYKQEVEEC